MQCRYNSSTVIAALATSTAHSTSAATHATIALCRRPNSNYIHAKTATPATLAFECNEAAGKAEELEKMLLQRKNKSKKIDEDNTKYIGKIRKTYYNLQEQGTRGVAGQSGGGGDVKKRCCSAQAKACPEPVDQFFLFRAHRLDAIRYGWPPANFLRPCVALNRGKQNPWMAILLVLTLGPHADAEALLEPTLLTFPPHVHVNLTVVTILALVHRVLRYAAPEETYNNPQFTVEFKVSYAVTSSSLNASFSPKANLMRETNSKIIMLQMVKVKKTSQQ
uniref:Uncharacterized protein n=1 Tax=Timema tahoe TaxID=61484 RepID=A0A7R9FHX0_9NEOP|nr:unnamed protein product [Timema tahoe]